MKEIFTQCMSIIYYIYIYKWTNISKIPIFIYYILNYYSNKLMDGNMLKKKLI